MSLFLPHHNKFILFWGEIQKKNIRIFIQISKLFEGNGGISRVKEKKKKEIIFLTLLKVGRGRKRRRRRHLGRWMAVIASSIFLLQSGNMGRKMVPSRPCSIFFFFQVISRRVETLIFLFFFCLTLMPNHFRWLGKKEESMTWLSTSLITWPFRRIRVCVWYRSRFT